MARTDPVCEAKALPLGNGDFYKLIWDTSRKLIWDHFLRVVRFIALDAFLHLRGHVN